jgi:hypothetical protein
VSTTGDALLVGRYATKERQLRHSHVFLDTHSHLKTENRFRVFSLSL